MLVFALGFLHVFDVQLDHLYCYQLSGVGQATPNLHVTAASASRSVKQSKVHFVQRLVIN